jgi:hypothetical protein
MKEKLQIISHKFAHSVAVCKLNDKKRPQNNPPPSSVRSCQRTLIFSVRFLEEPLLRGCCLLQGATNRTMDVMFASSKSRVVARVLVEHLLLPTMQGF